MGASRRRTAGLPSPVVVVAGVVHRRVSVTSRTSGASRGPAQERLPLWLGAKATEKNCARVADWGDGWMPLEARTGSDELFDGIARLRAAFTTAGRSPDELLVRAGLPFVRGDDGFDFPATREAALRLVEAGVTHFSVNLRRSIASAADARAFLEQLAEGLHG